MKSIPPPFDRLGEYVEIEGFSRKVPTAINGSRQKIPRADKRDGPIISTAAALRDEKFDPIRYVVPGYLADGCTILAGRPKIGKSWLMLDVGLAVAAGRYCLGEVRCDEGDVLYLALEDNKRRLQSRISKILGSVEHWPERFHYATEWRRAGVGGIDAVRAWITERENPRLVVVDVFAMFRSPSRDRQKSHYDADYEAIKGLQAIASETGVAIVIVYHLRKTGSESDPFEKVSGTMGLSGAADTVLVLDHSGQGITLYGRGRDIEEIETAVEFNRSVCRWRILGQASEVRRSNERAAILNMLREVEEPMTPNQVADARGMKRNNVKQLLLKMWKANEVAKARKPRGTYLHPGHAKNADPQ